MDAGKRRFGLPIRRLPWCRILRWAGTGFCALIVAAAIADLRWSFRWQGKHGAVAITAGSIVLDWGEFERKRRGFVINVAYDNISEAWTAWTRDYWRPKWASLGGQNLIYLPLWIPFILVGIPTAWLWRLDRRRPAPGHCRCGYDLTGNRTGRCPECGNVLNQRQGAAY